MSRQGSDILHTANNGSWRELLHVVQQALERLSGGTGPALLTFWASRGGGKTTFLTMVRDTCNSVMDVIPLGPWDASPISSDHFAREVLAAVEAAPENKKKVVLLDNLDTLLGIDDGTAFFDFEREVVHPLIQRGDVLMIATGRAEIIQWREYDVRARQQNYRIPALTPGETERLATGWHLDPARAYRLTLGHPQALCWLRDEAGLSEEEMAQRAVDYFLEGLSPRARELAEVVSLLPVFDVAVLRLLFPSQEGDLEGFYTDYLDRIAELRRAGLVLWSMDVGAYRFADSTVRRLLARGYRHRDAADFARIHRLAADYYQDEARRAAYLHYSLVSALYHLAQTCWLEGPTVASEQCLRWVRSNLGPWRGADWDAVIQAWQTGAGDEAVVEELKELIGSETVSQITSLLEAARQAAKEVAA